MNESKTMTQDPVCGMPVDDATALYDEHDGKTFYFCGSSGKIGSGLRVL
jgi:YHS domain-containing protein